MWTRWPGSLSSAPTCPARCRFPHRPGPSAMRQAPCLVIAAAVAWSIWRIATGRRSPLPEWPQRDRHGREIAIRYWSSGTSVRLTLLLTILFAAYPVAETPVKVNSAAGTGGSPFAGCARNWIAK